MKRFSILASVFALVLATLPVAASTAAQGWCRTSSSRGTGIRVGAAAADHELFRSSLVQGTPA